MSSIEKIEVKLFRANRIASNKVQLAQEAQMKAKAAEARAKEAAARKTELENELKAARQIAEIDKK